MRNRNQIANAAEYLGHYQNKALSWTMCAPPPRPKIMNAKKDKRMPTEILRIQPSIKQESRYHKADPLRCIGNVAGCVVLNRSIFPSKVFLRILLACLLFVSWEIARQVSGIQGRVETYFCRFANLLSNGFPFVGIVLLDGGKQRCALLHLVSTWTQEDL